MIEEGTRPLVLSTDYTWKKIGSDTVRTISFSLYCSTFFRKYQEIGQMKIREVMKRSKLVFSNRTKTMRKK